MREIVNGAVRASRFTHLPTRDAARAIVLGVLRAAQTVGVSVPAAASLACERLLWSQAALGEDLVDCASGIMEGAQEGAKQLNGQAQRVLQLVCNSALNAGDDIDPEQLEPTRSVIAKFDD